MQTQPPAAVPSDPDLHRRRLEAICNNATVALFIMDERQQCVYMNPAAERLTGYALADTLGRPLHEVVHHTRPDGRPYPLHECPIDRAFPKDDREQGEEVFVHRDGSFYPVAFTASPIREEGLPVGTIIEVRPLAAARRAQAALDESEERFRIMADGLPLIVWVHGAEGEQQFVNRTFCEYFGVEVAQMREDRWQMVVHADDAAAYLGAFRAAVEERDFFHSQARVRRADGQWRWLESWGRPRFAPDGEFLGHVGASADITDRKHAEAALHAKSQQLETLLTNAPLGVAFFDRDHRYMLVNDELAAINGLPRAAHIGRSIEELLPENARVVAPVIDRIFATGEVVRNFEVTGQTPREPGVQRHWLSGFYPVRDAQGSIELVGAWIAEISSLKRAEQKLREADARKDEYLATLAHELRNPLAPLRNSVELLRLVGADPVRQRVALDTMERNIAHMVRLIDDLLDVSRIATGKLHLAPRRLDLVAVVRHAAQTARPLIESRSLRFEVSLPGQPVHVQGDETRLDQVVSNLLANAAKFTGRGGRVALALRVQDGHALVRVEDTGIGIPPERLGDIFEMFAQLPAPPGSDVRTGGLGIGLNLARRLVELHGGTIDAASAGYGRGSAFEVRLPLCEAQPPEAGNVPAATGHDGAPLRILVVDDNIDAADTLAFLLEYQGNLVAKAYDGLTALRLAGEVEPELALVDLAMPQMSGFDVARALRARPGGARLRLIAMSGFGEEASKRRSSEAGFDAHLVKPVTADVLAALIVDCRKAVRCRAPEGGDAAQPAPAAPPAG